MTPEEKIANVEKQVITARNGLANVIMCPYCGESNHPEAGRICCTLFANAVLAVLHRQDVNAQKDKLEQLAEAVDKAALN